MAGLELLGLSVRFGVVRAVDDVSLTVAPATLAGLIGPNGAGKTTTIDAITGFVPHDGRVVFGDRDLSGAPPHERARAGLARTWQSLELFDDLTVAENCRVAAERPTLGRIARGATGRSSPSPGARHALQSVGLADAADRYPDELSLGERKLVAVARALASGPELVLFDEPAAGLDRSESDALGARLRVLVDEGIAVLLVDHDMGLVLSICDRIHVLEFGRLLASGTPAEIRGDERVIESYLGAAAPGTGGAAG